MKSSESKGKKMKELTQKPFNGNNEPHNTFDLTRQQNHEDKQKEKQSQKEGMVTGSKFKEEEHKRENQILEKNQVKLN